MSRAAIDLLVDGSLRSAAVALLVWVALKAVRVRDSSVQHSAWAIVLAGMLTMPVLSAVVPSVVISVPRVSQTAAREPIREPISQAAVTPPSVERGAAPPATVVAAGEERSGSPTYHASQQSGALGWPTIVLGLYALVTAMLVGRFALGWRRATSVVRGSAPVVLPEGLASVGGIRGRRVVESNRLVAPATIGAFIPVVVLPIAWRSWSATKLRAVIAHEQAHVRRRDPLVACLARLNVCLFWFHPAAWWVERKLIETSELACDEVGAAIVGDRMEYASTVAEIAADVSRHGARVAWAASGMGGSCLRTRLEHLAHEPARRAPMVVRRVIPAACIATAILTAGCRTGEPPTSISKERAAELQWEYPVETTVRVEDRLEYEAMLLEAKAQDPGGPSSARLGRFYASSMIGVFARVASSESPLSSRYPHLEITGAEWSSEPARRAREALAASNDPDMLVAAAEYLQYGPSNPRLKRTVSQEDWLKQRRAIEEERQALVRSYLERALKLDPDSVSARAALVFFRTREREHGDWLNMPQIPPAEWYDAISALDERERFEKLPYVAIGALSSTGVDRFKDPNLNEYVALREQQARRFAQDILALAPKFADHPDHGTAIFKAHITLGSLSLRHGDTPAAAEHLLLASDASVSEEIAYGRYFAYTRLVKQLLAAGEREAVALYLDRMAGKSVVDRERLLQEAQSVRDGAATVIFGPGYVSY